MLVKWTPTVSDGLAQLDSPIETLFREADGVFRPFLNDLAFSGGWGQPSAAPAEVVETEGELRVSVDLPGHDPKSLVVKVEGDTLTIQSSRGRPAVREGETVLRSERVYGLSARSFVLPATVDTSRCEARYEHGVLTVTLPRKEEARPRSVEVKVHS